MTQKEFEMPDEYKANLAHLAEFLEAREGFRAQIRKGLASGVSVTPGDKAMVDEELRKFDEIIDGLEKDLAAEYERYQAEMAREASITEKSDDMMDKMKHLYIIVKHQKPHLLESFSTCLDPLTPEQREQFLDDVAILEATKLNEILTGEA